MFGIIAALGVAVNADVDALTALVGLASGYTRGQAEQRHCVGACQQADQASKMGTTMRIKKEERAQCKRSGECPVKLEASALTVCDNGFAGVYPCNKVDMLSVVPLADLGCDGEGSDIWGWTDLDDGSEYAIYGCEEGTAFVDVSTPTDPTVVAWVNAHNGVSSVWRDIKVYANHAYIVSEASGHGMQVVDLTRLRDVNAANGQVTLTPDYRYTEHGSSHNMVINEDTGYGYSVGTSTCSGGLHVIDLSTPALPTFVGCFSSDGYTHDAQCVVYAGPDTTYIGREICFAFNEDTLTIVDVEDKNDMTQIARVSYSGEQYTHQGWLTENHEYILLNDELDEYYGANGGKAATRIFDVTDLSSPFVSGTYVNAVRSIDHNLYIKGDRGYLSNYESGLRIVDVGDIANANLEEVAYFDVHPTSNNVGFMGSWSVYPFFSSGTIVVSSIERGLFVLKHNDDPAAGCVGQAFDGVCQASETCANCPDDCYVGGAANGVCDSGETYLNCAADCGCTDGPAIPATCGDGVCDAGRGEDCNSCSDDCTTVVVRRGKKKTTEYCCGDSSYRCGSGCGGSSACSTSGPVFDQECCGDGTCSAGENSGACWDCGPTAVPPVTPQPTPQPTRQPTPAPTPGSCNLGAFGDSCRNGPDCCSGRCSGGKPSRRTCLN